MITKEAFYEKYSRPLPNTINEIVEDIIIPMMDHIEALEAENIGLKERLREVYYEVNCLEYDKRTLMDKAGRIKDDN